MSLYWFMIYDLLIIGGGPAGVAAGVYAGRKKIKTALITENFNGQSIVSADIQNWIGTKSISGFDLAKNLEEHVRTQDIEITEGELVEKVEKNISSFFVFIRGGQKLETKTILVASGSRRRKLGVPGEQEFDGKGVVYCATCDVPLFNNKTVAVVGAGNAGLEAARDLISYASKIYLLVRGEKIRGDAVTFEEISKSPKVEIIYDAEVKEIFGDKFVTGLKYLNKKANSLKDLKLEGVFVEIGSVANSGFVKDFVQLDQWGQIRVDHKTQMSSMPGIWAAGDVTDGLYKQNNIAAGDAIKAVLNVNDFLSRK